MEPTYRQEVQPLMIATYIKERQLMKQYKGYFVPEQIHELSEWECGNSFCSDIVCEECIFYPLTEVEKVKAEYEYISSSRLLLGK